MIEFVRSRHMAAPPDRIWPYVVDVTRWPDWFTEAERCEVLGGDGVGRRQRMYGHARGKATEIDSVVTASTPPTLLRWHHEAERVDGDEDEGRRRDDGPGSRLAAISILALEFGGPPGPPFLLQLNVSSG